MFFLPALFLLALNFPLYSIDTLGVEGGANKPGSLPLSFFESSDASSSIARILAIDKGTNGIKFNDPYNTGRVFNAWAGTFRGTINNQNSNRTVAKHSAR